MSTTRRDFLRNSSLFLGGLSFGNAFPSAIQRALAIEAVEGSTFLDAEHVVFLMQENRSFDHCYGTLNGVRGFNDPRALRMDDGLPVFFQTDIHEKIFGPFHLDIENTNSTWLGGLPHSWRDMVGARNDGKMNKWLIAKRPGNKLFRDSPLTMGYYNRKDIPFYFALADAFTVCDQHFCSSLTGTSANRSFFWSGSIRERPRDPEAVAHVDNGQINYKDVSWRTYPELLEQAGVSWCVYQNELSLPVGLSGEEEAWLANFTDNNLEFYKQYNVWYHPEFIANCRNELSKLTQKSTADLSAQDLKSMENLKRIIEDFSAEKFEALTDFEKNIHKKAFMTNRANPAYKMLDTMEYVEGGVEKKINVPKSDVFYQFRKDVDEDKLPTVSWLVAPQNFSDHPSAPWFGAWYVSEVLNILTKNPEIWKKTIFILTYDENDGYFDHVPPFVPPLTTDPQQGSVPKGMNTEDEWVTKEQERTRTGKSESNLASPIGLGYRVPMVVASPWTKGGWVNSEVFDLTSNLQFLEYFIEKKTGKKVIEDNISTWRREVCGNLTSLFHPAQALTNLDLGFVERDEYIARIFNAKEKESPNTFNEYTRKEILASTHWQALKGFPKQEKGVRKACALPYTLQADIALLPSENALTLTFETNVNHLKNKVYSAPFQVYANRRYAADLGRNWSFTVRDAEPLKHTWSVDSFEQRLYDLSVYGPNGFFRHFRGTSDNHYVQVNVRCDQDNALNVTLKSVANQKIKVKLSDSNYHNINELVVLKPQQEKLLRFDCRASSGWYNIEITIDGDKSFLWQYAGHSEDGKESISDPYMASFSE